MPPTVPAVKEALPLLPDPFYNALDRLSQKFKIAIVAEGRPFPQNKGAKAPLSGVIADAAEQQDRDGKAGKEPPAGNEGQAGDQEEAIPPSGGLSPEEEVKAIAERFDYTSVQQGNVYLLTKRYTNPEDIPEVTAEECRTRLSMPFNFGTRFALVNGVLKIHPTEDRIISSVNSRLLDDARLLRRRLSMEEFTERLIGAIDHSPMGLYEVAQQFYFQSHEDRLRATNAVLESIRNFDPIFHWQIIDKKPVFGYDGRLGADNVEFFLPMSDCDRASVVPYGTPLPRPDYWVRTEMRLPDPDPTDPATLPRETKRFLDDNGRSSRALTIADVVAGLNRREKGRLVYKVEPVYAAKHVTIAGCDTLPPQNVMQAIAAVYGLGVEHRKDDTVNIIHLPPNVSNIAYLTYLRQLDKYTQLFLPSPLYRAIHARFLDARTKPQNKEGKELLEYRTQFEFQRIADNYRNSALRMLRYLAEPQVKAQPRQRLALSKLDARSQKLFLFAQAVSGYASLCEIAEIPAPLFITHSVDFDRNVRITGGIYRKGDSPNGPYIKDPLYFSKITSVGDYYTTPDDTARLALFVTYVDPKTGLTLGPVLIFDRSLNGQ